MSRSWDQTVRLATTDERDHLGRMVERYGTRFYTCTSPKCDEAVTHFVGWRYITGKAGRVSSAERGRCEKHARSFAEKHGVEMPTEESDRETRTGYMAVSEVLNGSL